MRRRYLDIILTVMVSWAYSQSMSFAAATVNETSPEPIPESTETTDVQPSLLQRFELLHFRLQTLSLFQTGGYTLSGIASWNPQFRVAAPLTVGIGAGASILKGKSKNFLALEWGLSASYLVTPEVPFELFAGAQTWVNNGGTQALIGTNVSYLFQDKLFGVCDRIIGGYSALLVSGNLTHLVRVGLGVSL